MPVNTTNLTQGPGRLAHAVFGAVEPLPGAVATALDAMIWTDVGGTQDGVNVTIAQEYAELDVDQWVDVPERRLTKRDITMATNLAEPTLENLVVANNGGVVTSGAGYKMMEPSADITTNRPSYMALCFDGQQGLKARRIIVRKALSTDNIGFAYKKGDQTILSVTFSAHGVSDSVKPYRVIDEVAA